MCYTRSISVCVSTGNDGGNCSRIENFDGSGTYVDNGYCGTGDNSGLANT